MAYKHYLQRSERGKKIFIQRKQCATSNTGGDKLFLQTMFPNILVIRSQSGVTSLRDKPAAES